MLITFIIASIAGASLGFLPDLSQHPLIIGSFGAAIFLVMAALDLPFSQPTNVLAGQLLACAIGLGCFNLIEPSSFVMGLSLGLTTVAILLLESRIHLPASIQSQFFWRAQIGFIFLHRH